MQFQRNNRPEVAGAGTQPLPTVYAMLDLCEAALIPPKRGGGFKGGFPAGAREKGYGCDGGGLWPEDGRIERRPFCAARASSRRRRREPATRLPRSYGGPN